MRIFRVGAEYAEQYSGNLTVLGILIIFCGLFIGFIPMVATIVINIVAAIALIAAGFFQIVHAAYEPAGRRRLADLVLGLVEIAAGVAFLLFPPFGVRVISFMFVAALFLQGAFELAVGLATPRDRGRGWFVMAGLVSLGAAALLFLRLPLREPHLPGIVLAVALVLQGWAYLITDWRLSPRAGR